MQNIVLITQARFGSTRLPGKILKQVNGLSLLEIHLNRLKKSKLINRLIVATTTEQNDKAIFDFSIEKGFQSFRGSEKDVLDRFYQAVKNEKPEFVVRVTSDCPLIDPELVDKVIDLCIKSGKDYVSNVLNPSFPDGQDVEVFKFSALEKAWQEAKLESDREHVTKYIWENIDIKGGKLFTGANFESFVNYGDLRMTVDEQEDLEVITEIINQLGLEKTWKDYAKFLQNSPEINAINAKFKRNEGLQKSINKDKAR